MPRSKKQKVVSLTKTDKRSTRSAKGAMIEEIRSNLDQWKYVWVLSVGNMRNAALKDVRHLWKGTGRLFFARSKVMAKALGTTPEEEQKPNLHKVGKMLSGPVGLFFTSFPPEEVIEWFKDFSKPDFARSGNVAPKQVVLPEGPIVMYNDLSSPFPSSMDPQLRKLGLSTRLMKGVPSLQVPQVVCKKGDVLSPEQAQLLKLIGEQLAVFKVRLAGRWSEDDGWVELDGLPSGTDGAESDVEDGAKMEDDDD
ncbi:mRNA turnover and ribosome assembly protein [Tulasnella sp. JGI-2019a]|nr:mRNA turnover and ribosome assembly protein [Tulasnella sp. JGI-2019a]KAG9010825.1 mRNA turnover and ribosome assembly protein [Tulasnella sp. JGI-2019a]